MLLNRALRGVAARVGHVKAMSTLPRPEIDEDGLLEYSVVYTDRTLNHMCVCHLSLLFVVPSPPGGARHNVSSTARAQSSVPRHALLGCASVGLASPTLALTHAYPSDSILPRCSHTLGMTEDASIYCHQRPWSYRSSSRKSSAWVGGTG